MSFDKDNLRKARRIRRNRRGSLIVVAIVALVVISIMGVALMDGANATFQQGHRQPRLTSLQALADAGCQYGYWQYTYNNATLPYSDSTSPVSLGQGTFTVSVSAYGGIANTLQCVSTAKLYNDTYSETRIYNEGSGGSGSGSSAPSAPTNLTANAGTSSIGLTWTTSSGATSYDVYRGTTSGGESATPIATGVTSGSYTDTTAASGTTYYYYVTAVNSSGQSSDSNEANAKESSGYVTATPSTTEPTNNYSNTEVITLTNTQPMTSLTVTVVAQKTDGLTYNSAWNNFWSGYINPSYVDNGSTVTYTATETAGDSQSAGTYAIDDQFSINGPPGHSTTGDTYTVQVTADGVTQTLTGHF